MGISERREREKREVRQKILDAARSILVSEGADAVSMRRIAENIEYSATTIYLYFQDKNALLQELYNSDFVAFMMEFAPLASGGDLQERFRGAARIYAKFAVTHPHHFQAMFMRPHPYQNVGTFEDGPVNTYDLIKAMCEAAIAGGEVRPEITDAAVLAQTLWAGIHGVVALEVIRTGPQTVDWAPLETRLDAMVECLHRGMASAAVLAKRP